MEDFSWMEFIIGVIVGFLIRVTVNLDIRKR